MSRIAILAFGSLIEEPGKEIGPLIREKIRRVQTPFSIEFARSSSTRGGAPTLIPVDDGGSPVNGVLLVLDSAISLAEAKTFLWKRETRRESSEEQYSRPANPGQNQVVLGCIENFEDCDVVLYTKIGKNIEELNANYLAELAIKSARGKAGADGKDGISYLRNAVDQGIRTPLLPAYKAAILRKTEARDLVEARARIRKGLA